MLLGACTIDQESDLSRADVRTPLPIASSPTPPEVVEATMNLIGLLRAVGPPTPRQGARPSMGCGFSRKARPPPQPPGGRRSRSRAAAGGGASAAILQARLQLEQVEKNATEQSMVRKEKRKQHHDALPVIVAYCRRWHARAQVEHLRLEQAEENIRQRDALRCEAVRREELRRQEEIRQRPEPSVDELLAYFGLESARPESGHSSVHSPSCMDTSSPSLCGDYLEIVRPEAVQPSTSAECEASQSRALGDDVGNQVDRDEAVELTSCTKHAFSIAEEARVESTHPAVMTSNIKVDAINTWDSAEHVEDADIIMPADHEGWQLAGDTLGDIVFRALSGPASAPAVAAAPLVDDLYAMKREVPSTTVGASARSLDGLDGISLVADHVNPHYALDDLGERSSASASFTQGGWTSPSLRSLLDVDVPRISECWRSSDKIFVAELERSRDRLPSKDSGVFRDPRAWAGWVREHADQDEELGMCDFLSAELVAEACAAHIIPSSVAPTQSDPELGSDGDGVGLGSALTSQLITDAQSEACRDESTVFSLSCCSAGSPESCCTERSGMKNAKLDSAETVQEFGVLLANDLLNDACRDTSEIGRDVDFVGSDWSLQEQGLGISGDFTTSSGLADLPQTALYQCRGRLTPGSLVCTSSTEFHNPVRLAGDLLDMAIVAAVNDPCHSVQCQQRGPLAGAAAAAAAKALDAECAKQAADHAAEQLAARAALRRAALERELQKPEAEHEHERLATHESNEAIHGGVFAFITQNVNTPPSRMGSMTGSGAPTPATSAEQFRAASRFALGPGSRSPRGAGVGACSACLEPPEALPASAALRVALQALPSPAQSGAQARFSESQTFHQFSQPRMSSFERKARPISCTRELGKRAAQLAYEDACLLRQVRPNPSVRDALAVACDGALSDAACNFSGLPLGDRGLVPALLALARCPGLRRVGLADCSLRGASAKMLAELVRWHPSLEELDLRNNALPPDAGLALLQALEGRLSEGLGNARLTLLLAGTVLANLGASAAPSCKIDSSISDLAEKRSSGSLTHADLFRRLSGGGALFE